LFVHLEQLGTTLPVECRVLQKQKGRAGVDDTVGVFAKVIDGLANHGHAAKVLANRLDGSKSTL
jgi:hypothetical protein